jgi:hypothetical protein
MMSEQSHHNGDTEKTDAPLHKEKNIAAILIEYGKIILVTFLPHWF